MLNGFDWLRRSRSGAELLATLRHLTNNTDTWSTRMGLGAPLSATGGPCRRCFIYPRAAEGEAWCLDCKEILRHAHNLSTASRQAVIVWGFVHQVPVEILDNRGRDREIGLIGSYVHDANHFLVAMDRRGLRSWLQEMTVYFGFDLRGVLQVFPTAGSGVNTSMGDVLSRAVHWDLYLPPGQLEVRFFSRPHQLLYPRARNQQGMLTFDLPDFLTLLEMAEIFVALLRPKEQEELRELLNMGDSTESQFYWGRFLGGLEQRARDMLTAWNLRRWPRNRIEVFYELLSYVRFVFEN